MGDSALSIWNVNDNEPDMLSDLVDSICIGKKSCSYCPLLSPSKDYVCVYDEYVASRNRLIRILKAEDAECEKE